MERQRYLLRRMVRVQDVAGVAKLREKGLVLAPAGQDKGVRVGGAVIGGARGMSGL